MFQVLEMGPVGCVQHCTVEDGQIAVNRSVIEETIGFSEPIKRMLLTPSLPGMQSRRQSNCCQQIDLHLLFTPEICGVGTVGRCCTPGQH